MRYKGIVVEGKRYRLTMVTWTSKNIMELAETIASYHKDVVIAVNEINQLVLRYTRRSDGYRFFRTIDPGKEFIINVQKE